MRCLIDLQDLPGLSRDPIKCLDSRHTFSRLSTYGQRVPLNNTRRCGRRRTRSLQVALTEAAGSTPVMRWLVSNTREAHAAFQFRGRLTEACRPFSQESALCWTFQQLAGTFLGTTIVNTSVILWDQCCLRSYLLACADSTRPLGLSLGDSVCSRVGPRFMSSCVLPAYILSMLPRDRGCASNPMCCRE